MGCQAATCFFYKKDMGFKKAKSHHDIGSYPLSLAETLGKKL
jgi:hypothetical protein